MHGSRAAPFIILLLAPNIEIGLLCVLRSRLVGSGRRALSPGGDPNANALALQLPDDIKDLVQLGAEHFDLPPRVAAPRHGHTPHRTAKGVSRPGGMLPQRAGCTKPRTTGCRVAALAG